MAITFDKALGIHQHALEARVQRAEIMANNMANADTPGFKARGMDFQAVMQRAQDNMNGFGIRRRPTRAIWIRRQAPEIRICCTGCRTSLQ